MNSPVIVAKAGISVPSRAGMRTAQESGIPAFAGMTAVFQGRETVDEIRY